MKHIFWIAALVFEIARPGYRYEFPRDYFNHPAFQTEWWYYTGNLHTPEGRPFGFELTFFRRGVTRRENLPANAPPVSIWEVDDVYLAHLALSDIKGRRFYATERLNRAGPGLAGASLEQKRIWNGNWQVRWNGLRQSLQGVAEDFSFELALDPQKPPVIHGRDGISQKARGEGRASHYISFTRLAAAGAITLRGARFPVSGAAWMDHEFFTHQLDASQVGWDWFSIQVDNGTELMLFRLRRKDGSIDPYSAGTFVDRQGRAQHLEFHDFALEPLETWTSPATGARYPVHWKIEVPPLAIDLDCSTALPSQELVDRRQPELNYWEGAVSYRGRSGGQAATGVGYLEMTGYGHPVRMD